MTNREVIEESDAHQLRVYARFPVAFVRGRGSRLWDADGREYLDFFTGLAVANLGHCHPRVVAAIRDQAERLIHASNVYYNEPATRLATLLTEVSFADRVFFSNSGAEANEAAIKLARKYGADFGGGRFEIVSTFGAFHGRTIATVSAAGQEKHQRGFLPLVPGFRYVPFGDLKAMREAVRPETIGILVEPIQGEGGVNVPPDGYLKGLRQLCDERDLLILLDEVQTGIGRTGTLFAYEQEGIRPDAMALAKGLGGGLPIGAMLCTEKVAQALTLGTHGSTFGGNPVACAAGVAVIETLRDGTLLANARDMGKRLRDGFGRMRATLPMIREIRGRGLLLGVELDRDARPFVEAALREGIVANATADRVLRLLPPLVVTAEEVDRALAVFEKILREAA